MLYLGNTHVSGDPAAFVKEMDGFAKAGIEGVMVMPLGPDPVGLAEQLAAEVVPQLAEL